MKLDKYLKDFQIPEGECPARESVTLKEDEVMLYASLVFMDGEVCVIEYNGMCYGIPKKEVVDIESAEGVTAEGSCKGRPVALTLKKECLLQCRMKIKAGDLATGTWMWLVG